MHGYPTHGQKDLATTKKLNTSYRSTGGSRVGAGGSPSQYFSAMDGEEEEEEKKREEEEGEISPPKLNS
jgi:hypothetical protein